VFMSAVPSKFLLFAGLFAALHSPLWALSTSIDWGTHRSAGAGFFDDGNATTPSSINYLMQITATGASTSQLDDTASASSYDGDLVELGFFDTNSLYDGTDSTIAPNADSSNMFKGTWTPLTSKTTIGQDYGTGSNAFGDGLFFFKTVFNDNDLASDEFANTNSNAADDYDIMDDSLNSFSATDYSTGGSFDNDLSDRVKALNAASNALIGIRFYDASTGTNGSTRYNTIMNSAWTWQSNLEMVLHEDNGNTKSGLVFEFDNSDANTADITKVGTGDNTVTSNDFTATITYHDGTSNMDLSNGSHILSGLSGTGNITLGDDGTDVYTLHANAGNAYTFSGNLYNSSGAAADSTIIKTGSGEQIITGALYAGDSATAGLVIQDGKLTFAGANGIKVLESIRNGSGGTPVFELNNTTSGASTLVVIGLSQSQSAEYGGSVVLNGSGSETKIKTTYNQASYDSADYNRTQVFSGVVSSTGSNELVKGGVGELVLSGDNNFTGGVGIDDGTLIAGHANALGSSNTVTINKGKLEVDSGVTLAPTTITAGDSNKTMIGGRGTLNKAITIGSGNGQIDVISSGDGISSSLSSSSSMQQVSFGDRANAIGTFTVSNTLTLENGGVYDWEISDFTGTEGNDWDLLKFDTLNFDSTSDAFTINIMSLDANGSAGAMAGGNVWNDYTSSGFKFMEATGNGSGWTGTGSMGSAGYVSAFNVVDDGWSYYNNHHLHDWNVWYDGSGSFYLQYSVAPEPSTYVMVTGLMLVPGMGAVRKYRNRKKKESAEDSTPEISA